MKPCPFWSDDSRCALKDCHVQSCTEVKKKRKRKSCKRACMENIEHVFIAVNKQEINGIFFLTKQIDNNIYFIPISLFKNHALFVGIASNYLFSWIKAL